jgi:hypothetical protein
MAKTTVHEGASFDPYISPELQATTGPTIKVTDILELKGDDISSVGNSSFQSDKTKSKTQRKRGTSRLPSVPSVQPRLKRTPSQEK